MHHPQFAVGQAANVKLDVTAGFSLAGTTVLNTATVTAQDDTNPPADLTSSVLNVGPAADLSIVKTAPAQSPAGSNLEYSLQVKNSGPQDATGVTVTDPGSRPARASCPSSRRRAPAEERRPDDQLLARECR